MKEYSISYGGTIIVLVATDDVLDLQKCFFDGVQIGGVRREIFNSNTY
jgi:hypothetical protein